MKITDLFKKNKKDDSKENNNIAQNILAKRDGIFEAKYEKVDEKVIEDVLNSLTQNKGKIEEFFSVKIPDITIDICKDRETFLDKSKAKDTFFKGQEVPDWFIAEANGTDRIAMVSPQNSQRSYEEMLKVPVHELVHIANNQAIKQSADQKKTFQWMREGIAVLLSGQVKEKERAIMTASESELLGKRPLAAETGLSYSYGTVYTKYFIETYGKEKFLEMLQDNSQFPQIWQEGDEERAIISFLKWRANISEQEKNQTNTGTKQD